MNDIINKIARDCKRAQHTGEEYNLDLTFLCKELNITSTRLLNAVADKREQVEVYFITGSVENETFEETMYSFEEVSDYLKSLFSRGSVVNVRIMN